MLLRLFQNTILDISRKVVHREKLKEESQADMQPQQLAAPVMSYPAPSWEGFTPRTPLPIVTTAKYGHRYVAMITAWFQQGLVEAENGSARWVSIHQLFLDYQFQTGELGPIGGKRWTDTALQARFRLHPQPFRKRSSWFGRSFRGILKDHGCEFAVCSYETVF